MKRILKTALLALLIAWGIIFSNAVQSLAYPTLQLDIGGGTYDYDTSTIVSSGTAFTLYAFLIPNYKNTLNDTYYISAAVAPQIGKKGASLGSFTFNGSTVGVTGDMTYGVPPLENIAALQGWDKGDLPKHGIFPTYFKEFDFQFNSANQISKYNTQDRAISGNAIPTSGNGMYYAIFSVDISGLDSDYVIHFDLYNTKLKWNGDIDVTQFARFSHDAESASTKVPEPGALLLLGSGFVGLWIWSRRRGRKDSH